MEYFESRLVDAIEDRRSGLRIICWDYDYPGDDYLYELCDDLGYKYIVDIEFDDFSKEGSSTTDIQFLIRYWIV